MPWKIAVTGRLLAKGLRTCGLPCWVVAAILPSLLSSSGASAASSYSLDRLPPFERLHAVPVSTLRVQQYAQASASGEESPMDIVAAAVRERGYACDSPVRTERDAER